MERFNELRKYWCATIKTLKSLSTQALYFLLEPDDDSKFFESVDSFKNYMKETQFSDFQMLAIEYLLEYKNQNKLKIKNEPYTSNTGRWPFGSLDDDQIQECTKPNTIPTLTYIKDNITSTSIAPDKGKPACRCVGCELFDGYDMCCHHENFGSITQQSLDKCKKHNLLREKIL